MSRDDLYSVLSNIPGNGESKTVIKINKDHPIFLGHFPDVPVLPGVCMMQIVKELLESSVNRKLNLKNVAQLKFSAIINPLEISEVSVQIDYNELPDGTISSDASIHNGSKIFFKMTKAVYS